MSATNHILCRRQTSEKKIANSVVSACRKEKCAMCRCRKGVSYGASDYFFVDCYRPRWYAFQAYQKVNRV